MIELDKNAQLIKKQLWDIWGKLDPKILEKFKNQQFIIFVCDVDEIPKLNNINLKTIKMHCHIL